MFRLLNPVKQAAGNGYKFFLHKPAVRGGCRQIIRPGGHGIKSVPPVMPVNDDKSAKMVSGGGYFFDPSSFDLESIKELFAILHKVVSHPIWSKVKNMRNSTKTKLDLEVQEPTIKRITRHRYHLFHIHLAGMKKADVSLVLEDHVLHILADREWRTELEDGSVTYKTSIKLPMVEEERIRVRMSRSILRILVYFGDLGHLENLGPKPDPDEDEGEFRSKNFGGKSF